MLKNLRNVAIAASLGVATLVSTTAPAEARDRWHHRGGDDAAIAIGAGAIGLAVGAAIASDRHDGYYDRRYYRDYPRGYYYESYPRYYYRDYPRYRYHDNWRHERRYHDRYYRRGW
jgi:hypothetical protein